MRIRKLPIGKSNITGQKIEQIRKEKGYKQKYIVEKLKIRGIEITISTFSKIEGQTRQVADYELVAIADILDVSIYDLIP